MISATKLRTIVANATTSGMESGFGSNSMRHRWRQSGVGLDLRQWSNLKHLELPVSGLCCAITCSAA